MLCELAEQVIKPRRHIQLVVLRRACRMIVWISTSVISGSAREPGRRRVP